MGWCFVYSGSGSFLFGFGRFCVSCVFSVGCCGGLGRVLLGR